jgi:hypothetical protein
LEKCPSIRSFLAGSFPPPGKSYSLPCDRRNDKSRLEAGL